MLVAKAVSVTVLVVLLLVAVPVSTGSIHEVLKGTLKDVDDKFEQRLRMVVEVSSLQMRARTLKGVNILKIAQNICEAPNNTNISALVGKATDSLETTVADPSQAIIARRALLACIALHWMSHKQEAFEAKVEEHLSDLTRALYRIHVSSVAARGLLEYLHISKSGGTSFSAAAKHSDCRMAPGIGQLESLGDLARWINGTAFEELTGGTDIMWSYYGAEGRQGDAVSCRDRVSYLKELSYNYVSNEFTLHGGGGGGLGEVHACPQVVNVVTLRDPDSRLMSHLHFMLARMKKRLYRRHADDGGDGDEGKRRDRAKDRDGDGDRGGSDSFWPVFCPGNVTTWERVAPPVVDNYMTRSFIGERGFHSPVGAIGAGHAEVARRLLLQFDLVMDLDAGEEAADLVIQQGLGWNVKLSEVHARTSASVYAKLNYTTSECRDDALVQALLARQGPDRHLYSFGRVLALLDRLHFAMARDLGLEPALDGGRAGGSDSCGLLSAGRDAQARLAHRLLLPRHRA